MYPIFAQILLSFGCWCQQFHAGFMYGILAAVLMRLRDPDTPIKLTHDQESWIVSVMFLAMCPSNMTAGLLTSRYGRKYTFILYLLPSVGSVAFTYCANSYATLFIGFLLTGLSGGAGPIGTLIIAECSSPRYRGTFMDIKLMLTLLGSAAAHLMSIFVEWRTLVLFNTITIVVPFITCLISPESPAWLASKGRFAECKASFTWYRGDSETEEVDRLVDWQHRVLTKKKSKIEREANGIFHVFQDKVFWKTALISASMIIVYDLSGKMLIQTYVDIVNEITKDPANGQRNLFILDLSNIIAMCISAVAVTKVKRRKLLFGIGTPAVIWLYMFCGVSYLSSLNILPNYLSWLPFAMIMMYFFLICISILPILHAIQAEIFPLEHRGLGVVYNSIFFGVSTFVVMKITPTILKLLGVHGLFMVSAVCLSVCMVYFYYAIPETFNKTLQTIECDLMRNKSKKSRSDVEAKDKMLLEYR